MVRVTHLPCILLAAAAGVGLLTAGCVFPVPADTTPVGLANPFDEVQQSQDNHAPVANAGEDCTVSAGQSIALSAITSTDEDGDHLSYVWRQVGGSPTVEIQEGNASIARFTAPDDLTAATTLLFSVTVTDGFAAHVDQVQITIQP